MIDVLMRWSQRERARRRRRTRVRLRLRPRVPGPAMTTPTAPVAPPPPLARNRNFSLLWFGEGVSVLGNATTSVLLPLLAVVGFDAGPGWMGALTAAAWVPWLLIGLPAGAWVDRLPARRVMIVSDLVAALTLASVPVAWAARRPHAPPPGRRGVLQRRVHRLLPRGLPRRWSARWPRASSRSRRSPGCSAPSRPCRSPAPASAACSPRLVSAAGGLARRRGQLPRLGRLPVAAQAARHRADTPDGTPTSGPWATASARASTTSATTGSCASSWSMGGMSNFGLTGYGRCSCCSWSARSTWARARSAW